MANLFVVFEYANGKFTQAYGRNKTYKTIDGAVSNGIQEWGGPAPTVVKQTDSGTVVRYRRRTFVVVNILDIAMERAAALMVT